MSFKDKETTRQTKIRTYILQYYWVGYNYESSCYGVHRAGIEALPTTKVVFQFQRSIEPMMKTGDCDRRRFLI